MIPYFHLRLLQVPLVKDLLLLPLLLHGDKWQLIVLLLYWSVYWVRSVCQPPPECLLAWPSLFGRDSSFLSLQQYQYHFINYIVQKVLLFHDYCLLIWFTQDTRASLYPLLSLPLILIASNTPSLGLSQLQHCFSSSGSLLDFTEVNRNEVMVWHGQWWFFHFRYDTISILVKGSWFARH